MLSFIISSCSPINKKNVRGPKPLLKLPSGETLISYQIDTIKKEFPDSEILLTTGFESDRVIRNVRGVRIIENHDYKNSHTEDIRLAVNASSGDETVYIDGGLIFNPSALGIINGHSSVLVDKQESIGVDDIGVTSIEEVVNIMSFGIEYPKWGKIAFFTKNDTSLLKSLLNEKHANKKMMFEHINAMVIDYHKIIKAIEPKNTKIKVYS